MPTSEPPPDLQAALEFAYASGEISGLEVARMTIANSDSIAGALASLDLVIANRRSK